MVLLYLLEVYIFTYNYYYVYILIYILAVTSIYLPYFSQGSADRRKANALQKQSDQKDITPGSMWKNITVNKEKNSTQTKTE